MQKLIVKGEMLPMQRSEEVDVRPSVSTFEACLDRAEFDLSPLDQRTVYALLGNANTPGLLERIRDVKGEKRGLRPVGWVAPFEHTLDALDISDVTEKNLWDLVSDHNVLTGRIGGLVFLRGQANMHVKAERGIPDSIIPNEPNAEMQLFSVTGNEAGHVIVRLAMQRGIEPIMTSCNMSGEPEIVSEEEARQFASERLGPDVSVHVVVPDSVKPDKPRGSYPIVRLRSDHLEIVRLGFFSEGFMRALFSDIELRFAPGDQFTPTPYPDKVFDLSDLRDRENEQTLEQDELRIATLAALNMRRR